VCKSTVDGKPVGPDRVWPGGLAMSRTIGDHMVSPAATLLSASTNPAMCLHTTCHISSLFMFKCNVHQPANSQLLYGLRRSACQTHLNLCVSTGFTRIAFMKLLQPSCTLSLSCLGNCPQASSLYYSYLSCVYQPSRLCMMK